MRQFLPAILLTTLFGCGDTNHDETAVSYLQMPAMDGLDLPFSSAVRAGNTLYLSGNVGNIPGTFDLADMTEWSAMNDIYRTYFKNPPARSALGANGLALGARVEIECIAVTG